MRLNERLSGVLLIVVIVFGFKSCVDSAAEYARDPRGPMGAMIPGQPPDELNRIAHKSGLSIVAPQNWDRVDMYSSSTLHVTIAARNGMPRTGSAVLSVVAMKAVPDAATLRELSPVTFQDHPAFENTKVLRAGNLDDPPSSEWQLYVNRNGNWWHISFAAAAEFTKLPPAIRQFVDTVVLPDL